MSDPQMDASLAGLEVLRELRANAYIVKPVDFTQFVESVKEIGLYWAVLNRLPSLRTGRLPAVNSTPSRAGADA